MVTAEGIFGGLGIDEHQATPGAARDLERVVAAEQPAAIVATKRARYRLRYQCKSCRQILSSLWVEMDFRKLTTSCGHSQARILPPSRRSAWSKPRDRLASLVAERTQRSSRVVTWPAKEPYPSTANATKPKRRPSAMSSRGEYSVSHPGGQLP